MFLKILKKLGQSRLGNTSEPALFPDSHTANEWMSQKVAHYAEYQPNELSRLFDPSSGDYLPISVHVGSSWKEENQSHYRKIKKQFPDAIKKAKEEFYKARHINQAIVGDPEDFI